MFVILKRFPDSSLFIGDIEDPVSGEINVDKDIATIIRRIVKIIKAIKHQDEILSSLEVLLPILTKPK